MQVKVWNKNVLPYKEKFRDEWINIPAGGYILMEEDQAHLFKGTMGAAPLVDADGNKTPEGFKMISIEKLKPVEPGDELVGSNCQACGKTFTDETQLDSHIKADHAHLLTVKDDTLDAELRQKRKAYTK